MVLDGFGVSFDFGFVGNGYRLDGPTILSRIAPVNVEIGGAALLALSR